MEKRYTALRIISVLYKIIGVIVGILALIGAVLTLFNTPAFTQTSFGGFQVNFGLGEVIFALIIELIGGGLIAVGIYAIGELISLFINIEENTRFTALIVRDRMAPPPAQPPMQPPYQPPYQAQQPPYQPPEPPPQQVPPPYQPPEG